MDDAWKEQLKRQAEANTRFKSALLDSTMDSIIVHDFGGNLLYANKAAYESRGFTRDEFLAKNLRDLVVPELHQQMDAYLSKLKDAGCAVFESRDLRADGTSFPVEVRASVIDYQGKKVVVGVARDITDRKLAEGELAFKSKLIDSATDSIFVMDLQGNMIYVNEAAYKTRGYTRDELFSLTLGQLDIPEAAKLVPERIEKVRRCGSLVFESAHFKKDGSVMPVEVHASIIKHGEKEVITSIVRDITERKKTERALRESEQRYRTLAEAAHDVIFIIDRDDEVRYVNSFAAGLFGLTPDEIIGRPRGELFPKQLSERQRTNLERVFETGEPSYWEDKIPFPTGEQWQGTWLIPLKDETGKTTSVLGVGRDITEIKRAKGLSDALNDINAAISSTLDFDEIVSRVVVEAVRAIGCEAGAIALRDDHEWVIRYLYGLPSSIIGMRISKKQGVHLQLSESTKKPVVIEDVETDERINLDFAGRLGIRSVIDVPLVMKGDVIGHLCFHYITAPRRFEQAQIDFANKIAASVSLAIENARVYSYERNIAQTLQKALLTLPASVPGISFGHLYKAATDVAVVGGDFYDLFELGDNRVGMIIGDVAGKGLEAATMTSFMKSAIKACSYEHDRPAAVLSRVNRAIPRTYTEISFITAFFGILEVGSGSLTYCNAGHPPGLLRRADGTIERLGEQSPVVGAFAEIGFVDGRAHVNRGDALVLYTDGVTEARRGMRFFGEVGLEECLKRPLFESVEEIPDCVFATVEEFAGGKLNDDIALLAVALNP